MTALPLRANMCRAGRLAAFDDRSGPLWAEATSGYRRRLGVVGCVFPVPAPSERAASRRNRRRRRGWPALRTRRTAPRPSCRHRLHRVHNDRTIADGAAQRSGSGCACAAVTPPARSASSPRAPWTATRGGPSCATRCDGSGWRSGAWQPPWDCRSAGRRSSVSSAPRRCLPARSPRPWAWTSSPGAAVAVGTIIIVERRRLPRPAAGPRRRPGRGLAPAASRQHRGRTRSQRLYADAAARGCPAGRRPLAPAAQSRRGARAVPTSPAPSDTPAEASTNPATGRSGGEAGRQRHAPNSPATRRSTSCTPPGRRRPHRAHRRRSRETVYLARAARAHPARRAALDPDLLPGAALAEGCRNGSACGARSVRPCPLLQRRGVAPPARRAGRPRPDPAGDPGATRATCVQHREKRTPSQQVLDRLRQADVAAAYALTQECAQRRGERLDAWLAEAAARPCPRSAASPPACGLIGRLCAPGAPRSGRTARRRASSTSASSANARATGARFDLLRHMRCAAHRKAARAARSWRGLIVRCVKGRRWPMDGNSSSGGDDVVASNRSPAGWPTTSVRVNGHRYRGETALLQRLDREGRPCRCDPDDGRPCCSPTGGGDDLRRGRTARDGGRLASRGRRVLAPVDAGGRSARAGDRRPTSCTPRPGRRSTSARCREGVARCRAAWARLVGRQTCVVHGDPNLRNIRVTADRVALIDWDEAHVDVPDLDLVRPTTLPVSPTRRTTSPRKRGPHGKPPSAGGSPKLV